MTVELWDRDDIAAYLGVKVASVNSWLVRHGVKKVGTARVGHGRMNLYDPTAVRAAKDSSPGRGYRSDLPRKC